MACTKCPRGRIKLETVSFQKRLLLISSIFHVECMRKNHYSRQIAARCCFCCWCIFFSSNKRRHIHLIRCAFDIRFAEFVCNPQQSVTLQFTSTHLLTHGNQSNRHASQLIAKQMHSIFVYRLTRSLALDSSHVFLSLCFAESYSVRKWKHKIIVAIYLRLLNECRAQLRQPSVWLEGFKNALRLLIHIHAFDSYT